MNDNRLGLKIVRINQGYTDLLEINGNQSWTKRIWDIRKDLENIENLEGTSTVLMLKSIDSGYLLTVATLIEGRRTDCISAWIYIPNDIKISGKELVEIVDVLEKEILANIRNDDQLSLLFDHAYESAPAKRKTINSSGDKYAYRYYGKGTLYSYSLNELLDDINQSYYRDYKCIFLLDNSSNLKCNIGKDLRSIKIKSEIVLSPPSIVDGFEPYIDGQKFNQARYAFEGDNITIEWKRKGYKTIRKEIKVQKEIECPKPSPNEYVIEYPYEYIRVKDENGQEIEDYNLWIEGHLIRKGEVAEISEDKKSQSQVEVSANGYEEYKQSHDLRAIRYLDIRLKKKKYSYTFVLYSKDNEELEVEYSTTKKYLNSSPIEGYKTRDYIKNGVKNILKYSPSLSTSMKIVIGVACAIALFMGIAGGFYFTKQFYADKISSLQLKVEEVNKELSQRKVAQSLEQPIEESHMSNDNWDRIVKYLDKQKKWKKDEMDKFPEIVGLWDAINSYDKRAIESFQVNLSRSENYKRLLEAIANVKTQLSGPYNKENDFVITVDSYIKNLIKKTAEGNDSEKKNNEDQDAWM